MPKISTTTLQILFASCFRLPLLLFITVSCSNFISGQSPNPAKPVKAKQGLQEILPSHLGQKWKADGATRVLSAEQFSILPIGDIFAEYGLETITTRNYTDGMTKYTVEVFQMTFISRAYGLFTFNRGSLDPNRHEFYHNRYLVSISSEDAIDQIDSTLVDSIKQNLPTVESGQMPSLPMHLPNQDKIAGSEKYFVGPLALAQIKIFSDLKDAVIFTGGAEAVTASYTNGSGKMELLLIEYHNPQLATDGYVKLQTHFAALPQQEKEKRILTRTGNYIIEAANIEDNTSAKNIIGQIKYTPKVYWEGRKQSDIPFEFRPPDPAAIEEALQTANVLIRTFYWIGVMLTSAILLGVLAGGSFFYWKRYRRRKRGLDNLFSDAGGTIRLNLDDYLLTSSDQHIKKIGKGKEEN